MPQDPVSLAIQYLNADKPRAARKLLRSVLSSSPNHADANHILGIIALQAGKFELARKHISTAIRADPQLIYAHNNLGEAFRAQGRLNEAAACYRKVLEIDPDMWEGQNNLGIALEELGETEEAVTCYRKASSLNPGDIGLLQNLATALHRLRRLDEAEACLREILAIDSKLPDVQNYLGIVLEEMGEGEEAITCYSKAASLNPDDIGLLQNLATALQGLGRLDEAEACFRQALKRAPENADVNLNFGWVSFERGNMVNAARLWQQALEFQQRLDDKSPKLADIHEALGRLPADIGVSCQLNEIRALEERQDSRWTKEARLKLQFAKGHALEVAGEYASAWKAFENANAAIWKDVSDDAQKEMALAKRALADVRAFDTDGIPPVTNSTGIAPIFIIGASRSGKTTFERLLALLADVHKGYEYNIVHRVVTRAVNEADLPKQTDISDLPDSLNAEFSRILETELREFARAGRFVTFTNPGFIRLVGQLAQTIENAVFVFVKRRADDNLLRCYQTHYGRNNYYSYDLDACREYLKCYNETIDVWAAKMADRSILLNYEDMIPQPRAALERLAQLVPLELPANREFVMGDDRGCARPYTDMPLEVT